jgi:replicative DNA helicase
LIIVAARPAMGKTAFSLSLARNAAVDFQVPVAVFSLEMSALQLVTRLISAECHISSDKLRKGDLNDAEWERLHSQLGSLAEANIYINDTPALNVFEFRANARRLKQHKNIGLIVVDYLQLMTAHSDKKGGMREQEISTISRSLKAVAKELNIPIIALSQLSRAVETRPGDKKPQLSDLRESGAIEQDADMVCFIYRPEYYGIKEVDGKSMEGIAKIIIAKHRNGELDEVDLEFVSQYVKFINLAPGRDQFPNGFGGGSFNPETRTLTLPSRMDNSSDEDEDPLGDTPF